MGLETRTGVHLTPDDEVERALLRLGAVVRASSGLAEPAAIARVLDDAATTVAALPGGTSRRPDIRTDRT